MDCEKYEPLLIDELYDELDEVTSAAVKRHVSGCARCSAILTGMRGTRSALLAGDGALPDVPFPAGLEDRIFAATREAQKVTPIRSRASRALSWAGSWAMRPQTAMAAVFLLMIGSSAFLLRSKRDAASSSVSVTVAGEPAAPNAAADHDSLDDKAAAAAHGATAPVAAAPVAAPYAAPSLAASAVAQAQAPAGPIDALTGQSAGRAGGDALGSSLAANAYEGTPKDEPSPEQKKKSEAPPPAARVASQSAAPRLDDAQDSFSAGMASYRARSFSEATRQFDQAAQSGDANASLWAAKSTRDGSGCAAGLPRFEAVASKAAGTYVGSEASFEAAQCQVAMNHVEAARSAFTRLMGVPSHEARARAALAEMDHVAARSSAAGGAGGGGYASPKAAAPAKPQATATTKPAKE